MLLFLKDHFTPFPNPENDDHAVVGPPSSGLWHHASLVCRHWRRQVLGTPGLWTTIKICDDLDAMNQWTTAWQSRSGVLPLTVVFTTYLSNDHLNSHIDILRSLAENRHISRLCFYEDVSERVLKLILTLVAGQLETLFLIAGEGSDDDPSNLDEPLCELPRLQVLSVVLSPHLQGWPTGELRHLSLGCGQGPQEWRDEYLAGFLATLKANTRLEELMLRDVSVPITGERWEAGTALPGHHWPIRMPELKRLFVEESGPAHIAQFWIRVHPMEDVLDQTLSLPPTCTRYYVRVTGLGDIRMGYGKPFPLERIAVSGGDVVGTDGISACILKNRSQLPLIDYDQVRELWLQVPYDRSSYNGFHLKNVLITRNKSILDLRNIVKLVIQPQRLISFWLRELESGLPALQELHILMQYHDDRQTILQFLARRKQNGLQVDTLHFIGDPTSDTSEAFNSWKENQQEFRRQVNRVVFEEVCIPATDSYFEELVSTRLGIPEACKHPSPMSELWKPWTEHVSFD